MSAQKPSLGKGLDALFSDDLDRTILQEDNERVQKLLISDIVPNPDQPRREFDQTALNELAQSLEQHGVVQPIIVVRMNGDNKYRIIAGERRWRAAQIAELSQIPAIVRSLEELEQIELSLIENIQRVDLSPLEQAMSVYKLQQQFNLGLDEIAKKLGKAPSTVSNLSRLLQLPPDAMEALRQGKISEGHARAILSLKGMEAKQAELLRSIQNNGWTVRQAEQFATAAKRGADTKSANNRTTAETQLTRGVGQKLGTKVQIKHTAKGGQLIIRFDSDEHLAQIAQKIETGL
jgi:ParB family chromosome partitioning protein